MFRGRKVGFGGLAFYSGLFELTTANRIDLGNFYGTVVAILCLHLICFGGFQLRRRHLIFLATDGADLEQFGSAFVMFMMLDKLGFGGF